jgi:hypothetical protein
MPLGGEYRTDNAGAAIDQLTKTANICLIYEVNVWLIPQKDQAADCDTVSYELHGRL